MAAMILEVEGLAKRYDSTVALADASLTLRGGQIHALVGENGAGKSTLIKVLTGSVMPDAGTIRIDGRPVSFHNARQSVASGISVVHQERNLVPRFSVAENLLLGRSPYRRGFLDYASLAAVASKWLDRVGLDVDPRAMADTLSVAQAQLVEIARALSQDCEILLLDEPTSAIGAHETETLFTLLRDLRQQGTGIMFVSHKLDEVEELCEVATVLRDGRTVVSDRSHRGHGGPRIPDGNDGSALTAGTGDWPAPEAGAPCRWHCRRARGRQPCRPRRRDRRALRARGRRPDGAGARDPGAAQDHERHGAREWPGRTHPESS
jgi:ribose transport system ATP-binding protein